MLVYCNIPKKLKKELDQQCEKTLEDLKITERILFLTNINYNNFHNVIRNNYQPKLTVIIKDMEFVGSEKLIIFTLIYTTCLNVINKKKEIYFIQKTMVDTENFIIGLYKFDPIDKTHKVIIELECHKVSDVVTVPSAWLYLYWTKTKFATIRINKFFNIDMANFCSQMTLRKQKEKLPGTTLGHGRYRYGRSRHASNRYDMDYDTYYNTYYDY